jgi:hypothetical protein
MAFMRTSRVISDAGAKDTVVAKLANLAELVVGHVPELKLAILHEGLDRPEEIMLHEEWDGTRRSFSPMKRSSLIGWLVARRPHT